MLAPGDEATASTAGLRLRQALERSFHVEDIAVHVDASVGIALYPEHAPRSDRAAAARRRRDVRGQAHAHRPRGLPALARPPQPRAARARRRAARRRSTTASSSCTTSPRPTCRAGPSRGVEALVRWQHPRRGLLTPAHFLPLAEQSGLTRALTAYVLDRALAEIGALIGPGSAWRSTSGPPTCSTSTCPSEVARALERRALRAGAAHARGLRGPRSSPTRSGRSRCCGACARSGSGSRSTTSATGSRRSRHLRQPRGRRAQDRPLSSCSSMADDDPRLRDRARDRRPGPPARAARRRRGRRDAARPGTLLADLRLRRAWLPRRLGPRPRVRARSPAPRRGPSRQAAWAAIAIARSWIARPVLSNSVTASAPGRPGAAPASTAPRSVTSARATAPASTAPVSSPPCDACAHSSQNSAQRATASTLASALPGPSAPSMFRCRPGRRSATLDDRLVAGRDAADDVAGERRRAVARAPAELARERRGRLRPRVGADARAVAGGGEAARRPGAVQPAADHADRSPRPRARAPARRPPRPRRCAAR